MSDSEFPRLVDRDRLGDGGKRQIAAESQERAALAARFDLVSVDRLEATLVLDIEGDAVTANGRMVADIVQNCAISGEGFPVHIDEPIAFRFVAESSHHPEEEVELTGRDCDEIEYAGDQFDLGEAVAQSLALAIDPFAVGPQAETVRRKVGLSDEASSGPFAALAALKKAN